MIIGVDEVGRGSWAGPICVAAVAWPDDAPCDLLDDSKKIPAGKRAMAALYVRTYATDIGIGWVSPRQIDNLGVTEALKLAASLAVRQINIINCPIVIDGNLMLIDNQRARTEVKADCSVPAVMAASIIAKVARDNYMVRLDGVFVKYGFAKHVGYGTALHRAAITEHGPCEHHRFSYAPLKRYAEIPA